MKNDNFIFIAVVVVLVFIVGVAASALQPRATDREVLAQACVIVVGLWYLASLFQQDKVSARRSANKKPVWESVSGKKTVGDIDVTLMREGSQLPSASHVWARKDRHDRRKTTPVTGLVNDCLANAKAASLALHCVELMPDERLDLEVLVDVMTELKERLALAEKIAREESKARRNANKKGDGQVVQVNGSAQT